jgi:hypothetical protein
LRAHVGELQLQIAFLPLETQRFYPAGGTGFDQALRNIQLFIRQT